MTSIKDLYFDQKSLNSSEKRIIQKCLDKIKRNEKISNDSNIMFFDEWAYENKLTNSEIDIIENELNNSKYSIFEFKNNLDNAIIISYYGDTNIIINNNLDINNALVITL